MFKFIFRLFIKITGILPYVFIIKPMTFFASEKAKKEYKKNKDEGVIYISNHISSLDYYWFLFRHFFRVIHTFVSEAIYKNIFLKFLNWIMGNIFIDRNHFNGSSLIKAEKMLLKKKTLLIFPEGHYEKEKGKLEKFQSSAVILAYRTNTPIIPHYTLGDYHLFKRNRVIVGEKIYLRKVLNKETLSEEDINYLCNYLQNEVKKLKEKLICIKKYRTQTIFTFKYWILDLAKITSFPVYLFVFMTKKIFLGNKKEIKKTLKYNVLLAGNHTGFVDILFIYFYFFSRRTKIIASDKVFVHPLLSFFMRNSGVIKFNVTSDNKFDFAAFKETVEALTGNGSVGIFPEGHIRTGEDMLPLEKGLATFSILTNTPIIPYFHVKTYRAFRYNKVLIGNPIYPPKDCKPTSDEIEKLNKIIVNSFKTLENLAKTNYN